jgi:dTDP-4-amino-4,6-dideoxygalactose transaminase
VAIIEAELRDAPGVEVAHVYPDTQPNYWAYPVRVPAPLGTYAEINYLEVVFQDMQRTRRTSVGYPLPDYVRYEPGLCPNAEAAAQRFWPISTYPLVDPETVQAAAQRIREAVAQT